MIVETTILIILLVLSGFFSGSEVALFSLTRIRVRQLVEQKVKGAWYIKKLKDNPQRMLATILIGNNLCNVASASIMTVVSIRLFGDYAIGVATGVMTFLILVFGEITPKSMAANSNEKFAQIVAGPIWYLSVAIYPVIYALERLLHFMNRMFKVKTGKRKITEDDIMTLVKVAHEEGSIQSAERNLIFNVFEFDETVAQEVMVPRSDVVMIKHGASVSKALKTMSKYNYSRLPVYKEHTDDIVGIIYLKDIMRYSEVQRKNTNVEKAMRDPYFVPGSKKIGRLLKQFQKRKIQMAMVVDEHGSITGLVTLEDVLEEIVGEIADETEKVKSNVKKVGENEWLVSGKADIGEINKKIRIGLDEEAGYNTISGFFLEKTGVIPRKGSKTKHKKFELKIKEIEGNRISKLLIKKL